MGSEISPTEQDSYTFIHRFADSHKYFVRSNPLLCRYIRRSKKVNSNRTSSGSTTKSDSTGPTGEPVLISNRAESDSGEQAIVLPSNRSNSTLTPKVASIPLDPQNSQSERDHGVVRKNAVSCDEARSYRAESPDKKREGLPLNYVSAMPFSPALLPNFVSSSLQESQGPQDWHRWHSALAKSSESKSDSDKAQPSLRFQGTHVASCQIAQFMVDSPWPDSDLHPTVQFVHHGRRAANHGMHDLLEGTLENSLESASNKIQTADLANQTKVARATGSHFGDEDAIDGDESIESIEDIPVEYFEDLDNPFSCMFGR